MSGTAGDPCWWQWTGYPGPQHFPPLQWTSSFSSSTIGCICPPGANKECERMDCPRKGGIGLGATSNTYGAK